MPSPTEEFVTLLDAVELPAGTSIYPAPSKQIAVPAIVIRPDFNWMSPDRFCYEAERYVAMPVVTASTGADGIALLRSLSLAIIKALVPPWDWESVEGPVIDESTGTPFLANRVRLIYKNGGSD